MDFISAIKDRIKISTVVGESVPLRQAGNSLKGLCPFHTEKTPSFIVNDEKGTYHCFGCGAHGDVFSFVESQSGMSFKDALQNLAARAGITLPKRAVKEGRQKELEVLQAASEWFQTQLRALGQRTGVQSYLTSRGIGQEAQEKFCLGYAPREGLYKHLLSLGFEKTIILSLGLCKKTDYGGTVSFFDFFQDRIIFPIKSSDGGVIAFGGRALGNKQPKYINSPDSPVFKKGFNLYNQDSVREHSRVFVAEGYTDVIAICNTGRAAVAPLGTALTAAHLSLLRRRGCTPILCFDGDEAGERAVKRVAELTKEPDTPVVRLPPGEDPASLACKGLLDGALSRYIPIAEITRHPGALEEAWLEGFIEFLAKVGNEADELADLPPPLRSERLLSLFLRHFGLDEEQDVAQMALRLKSVPLALGDQAGPMANPT